MTHAEEYAKGKRRYLANPDIRHVAECFRKDAEWSLQMSLALVGQAKALMQQAESIFDQAQVYRDEAENLGIETDRLPRLPPAGYISLSD